MIETKQNYDDNLPEAIEQLSAYVSYEKQISNYTILSILANTNDNRIIVWQGEPIDNNLLPNETSLKNFEYYINLLKPVKRNNREQVMKNTYQLNEELHAVGIPEKLRGQFVGTCLLAIKNNLIYNNLTTKQIIAGIKEILERIPAGRWGTPEDLQGPAVFLASDASDFVNGHILYVDGGILAYIGKQP